MKSSFLKSSFLPPTEIFLLVLAVVSISSAGAGKGSEGPVNGTWGGGMGQQQGWTDQAWQRAGLVVSVHTVSKPSPWA